MPFTNSGTYKVSGNTPFHDTLVDARYYSSSKRMLSRVDFSRAGSPCSYYPVKWFRRLQYYLLLKL